MRSLLLQSQPAKHSFLFCCVVFYSPCILAGVVCLYNIPIFVKTQLMIQQNELRIGNWVQCDGEYFQSTAYTPLVIERGEKDIDPIPLTPEVLEKCGFNQLPHFTVQNSWMYNLDRSRFLSVACVGTPNEMVFLTEEDAPKVNSVIVIRNYDYDGKTYLHQLQNLYFALTGEELEYKQ